MYTGRLRPQTFASFIGFVRLVSTSQVLVTTGLELELIIVLKAKSLSQICGPIIYRSADQLLLSPDAIAPRSVAGPPGKPA